MRGPPRAEERDGEGGREGEREKEWKGREGRGAWMVRYQKVAGEKVGAERSEPREH